MKRVENIFWPTQLEWLNLLCNDLKSDDEVNNNSGNVMLTSNQNPLVVLSAL